MSGALSVRASGPQPAAAAACGAAAAAAAAGDGFGALMAALTAGDGAGMPALGAADAPPLAVRDETQAKPPASDAQAGSLALPPPIDCALLLAQSGLSGAVIADATDRAAAQEQAASQAAPAPFTSSTISEIGRPARGSVGSAAAEAAPIGSDRAPTLSAPSSIADATDYSAAQDQAVSQAAPVPPSPSTNPGIGRPARGSVGSAAAEAAPIGSDRAATPFSSSSIVRPAQTVERFDAADSEAKAPAAAPGAPTAFAASMSAARDQASAAASKSPATAVVVENVVSASGRQPELLPQAGTARPERRSGSTAAAPVESAAATLAAAQPFASAENPIAAAAGLHSASALLAERVVDQVSWWLSQKIQGADFRIEMPGGQPVSVNVQVQGNEAHVVFRSDQAEVRHLLGQALPQLKHAFGSEGMLLAGASVGGNGAEGAGQYGAQAQQRHARFAATSRGSPQEPIEATAAVRRARNWTASGGGLDLYV